MNATATDGDRVNIDLYDLAAGVEPGQQLVAVAIGGLVANSRASPTGRVTGLPPSEAGH